MSEPAHATSVPSAPRLAVPPEKRRAIVVGASTGMGAALVRQLAREGYRVAALARRPAELTALQAATAADAARSGGQVLTRVHDVKDAAAVPELFEELVRALGGLQLLVFAAGIMPKVGPDEYPTATDLEILEINVGGCIAWCNPAAEYFQKQREGTLVGISSIAGDRGRKGNPAYGTSKAAMNTYLEALRNRLGEHGVHVCTIKPGYIDTAMTRGMPGLFWLITAEEAADTILRAARGRANVRYVPYRWIVVGTIIRLIPSFIFRKLNF